MKTLELTKFNDNELTIMLGISIRYGWVEQAENIMKEQSNRRLTCLNASLKLLQEKRAVI